GRGLVGWSALIVASAGLLHLGKRQPTDLAVLEQAGGWLGRGVGSGLAAAVTPYVAVVLLCLLAVFGLLVVTATPIKKIPQRLLALWQYLVGAPPSTVEEGEVLDPEPANLPALRRGRGGARRRQGVFADDAEVYDELAHDAVVVQRRPLVRPPAPRPAPLGSPPLGS